MRELIQHAKACGTPMRADTDDPQLVQEEARIDDKIIVQAQALMSSKAVIRNVANKHWVSAQVADPVIQHVQGWMARPREDKTSLSVSEWQGSRHRSLGLCMPSEGPPNVPWLVVRGDACPWYQ